MPGHLSPHRSLFVVTRMACKGVSSTDLGLPSPQLELGGLVAMTRWGSQQQNTRQAVWGCDCPPTSRSGPPKSPTDPWGFEGIQCLLCWCFGLGSAGKNLKRPGMEITLTAPAGKWGKSTKLPVYGSPLLRTAPFFLAFAFPFLLPALSSKAQDPVPSLSPRHLHFHQP